MASSHPNTTCSDPLMTKVARYIENHIQTDRDEKLTLENLSAFAHLSPYHLQRRFKAAMGVSPKTYEEGYRIQWFKSKLQDPDTSVTEAMVSAGYSSSSRLYSKTNAQLGMTPRQYQQGGKAVSISYETVNTPLGLMMMGATDRGLCFLQFGNTLDGLVTLLHQEFPHATIVPCASSQTIPFQAWSDALCEYLRGQTHLLHLPLDIQGTAFQQTVWTFLQTIPPGQTMSYTEVAQALGKPKAHRAVASACAKNKIALLIPCHRVLRSNGDLAGYRWGMERKETLLKLEQGL